MTERDEHGNKVLSSGPDGFFVIDFSTYQEGWTNVSSGSDDANSDIERALINAPKIATPPAAEWRDKAFELEVSKRKRMIRVDNAARTEVDKEDKDPFEEPEIHDGAAFLDLPFDPTLYRINQLWPNNGNVLFAAPAKFGKSTIMMNLLRSMLTGGSFLAHFECPKINEGESILLIDLEMSGQRVQSEIISQDFRVLPGTLKLWCGRGRTKNFDFTDAETRAYWVAYCKQHNVKTLIIDPIAPLLGYLSIEENDNAMVTRFFQQLDEFKAEAGVRDMIVTHHCGHHADFRPRGASRFNDWPDALWLAKIDGPIDDPASPRKFFVRGRDVGEEFQASADIQRDLNNDKRLIINMQSASVSNADGMVMDAIEEIIQAIPAITLDSAAAVKAGADTIMSKLQWRATNGLLPGLAEAPKEGKIRDLIKALVSQNRVCGAEHKRNGAAGASPTIYYVSPSCPCASAPITATIAS